MEVDEPMPLSIEAESILSFEDFLKKTLYNLLIFILQNYRANWIRFPYTEKYYHCSKQCFIKRYSKCGGDPVEANKLIKKVLNLENSEEIRHIFSEELSNKLEEVLEYFN